MTELDTPLGSHLEKTTDEVTLARMWAGIDQRRRRKAPTWWELGRVATLSAAVAAAVLLAINWYFTSDAEVASVTEARREVPALARADGTPLELSEVRTEERPHALSLSDGSTIRVDVHSRFEVLAVSPTEVVTSVRSGRTVFDIRPGGPRRWSVEAGPVTVEVVGTRFVVERDAVWVRVAVERGAVLVRGELVEDGVQRLGRGEAIEVGERPRASAAAPPHELPAAAGARHRAEPSVAPPGSSEPAAPEVVHVSEEWRAHAASGKYEAAFENLGAEGFRRASERASSANELMSLADVARLSGHPADAVLPLQLVLRRFASSPEAPLAAMTLGRTLLLLGRAGEAAVALEEAIARGLPSGLMEDAFVRLARAYLAAGDTVRARAVLARYDARFMSGRRRSDIVSLLAEK